MCISGLWETLVSIGLILIAFAAGCGFKMLIDWLLESNLIGRIVGVMCIVAWAVMSITVIFAFISAGNPNIWIFFGYSAALCVCIVLSFLLDPCPFKTGSIVGTVVLLLLGGLVTYGHWANIYCGTDCGFLTEWGHFIYADAKPIV